MNSENIEMIVNEMFDDLYLVDNYKVDDVEVFDYLINDDIDLRLILISNRCVIMKKDDILDEKVVKVCNNDDEVKEFLESL